MMSSLHCYLHPVPSQSSYYANAGFISTSTLHYFSHLASPFAFFQILKYFLFRKVTGKSLLMLLKPQFCLCIRLLDISSCQIDAISLIQIVTACHNLQTLCKFITLSLINCPTQILIYFHSAQISQIVNYSTQICCLMLRYLATSYPDCMLFFFFFRCTYSNVFFIFKYKVLIEK